MQNEWRLDPRYPAMNDSPDNTLLSQEMSASGRWGFRGVAGKDEPYMGLTWGLQAQLESRSDFRW